MLLVVGRISYLLLPNTGQSNLLTRRTGCKRCFLYLLLNSSKSDPLSISASGGHFLLLKPNTRQYDPLGGGAGYVHFLHLLLNPVQSDCHRRGTCPGHCLLPCWELHSCEMSISDQTS